MIKLNNLTNLVTGIEEHHQKIKKGYVFFAIPGIKTNGESYINLAIQNGAKFIILDKKSRTSFDHRSVKFIKVSNPKKCLSQMLSYYYSHKPKNIVAVTGTNGKTSVVNFFQQICSLLGYQSASIGTLGVTTSKGNNYYIRKKYFTSPMPIELHKILQTLYNNSYTHIALEASSHGIYQHRLDNINFNAVGFTNFSHDHLDYHITLKAYLNAKLRIFDKLLKENKYAVINADIKEFELINQICQKRNIKVLSYGKKAKDLKIKSSIDNTWEIEIFNKKHFVNVKIDGVFQFYNILCSLGLAIACNLPIDKTLKILGNLKPVKGRLELVQYYKGAKIYIDYAHTPDALKTVLQTLREQCNGKLHVLFGCGGQRDQSKRVLMGEIANNYADCVIITDDNPRNEEKSDIRKQILRSCSIGKEIEGRSNAIKYSIKKLKQNDILVIAGKGHENHQIIGNKTIYFSDLHEIRKHTVCNKLDE